MKRGGHGEGAPEGGHGAGQQPRQLQLGGGGGAGAREQSWLHSDWSQRAFGAACPLRDASRSSSATWGRKGYSQELTMARSAIASSAFLAWCLENIRMICGMGSFSEANCDDEGEWEESAPATYLERLRPA